MITIDLHELLEQSDLYTYVSQYVDLEYRGGEYWGLSPFNPEKTPSFSLNNEKQVWKDFSSGKGGNIITFIMEYDSCSPRTAIEKLVTWLNLPDGSYAPPPGIVRIMKKYAREKDREEPKSHIILPESELSKYEQVPIMDWEAEGISSKMCKEFEICYDPYEEAIIIPIRDSDGALINICRRTTDPRYKEIGIPKYIYKYHMGTVDFFYGWYKSKKDILEKREVVVVEGAKSVMKLYGYGYKNSVAALTSHINEKQMKILAKSGCAVIIAFDKDAKPFKDENIKKLRRYCPVFYTFDREGLLGEKDAPVDKGKEVWERLYQSKIRL